MQFIFRVSTLAWLLVPGAARAQSLVTNSSCNITSGQFDASCVPEFILDIVQVLFGFVGAACLIMIIIAGYQIALAKAVGRDKSEGFTRLRIAIIGFILCWSSWYIIDFIVSGLAGS